MSWRGTLTSGKEFSRGVARGRRPWSTPGVRSDIFLVGMTHRSSPVRLLLTILVIAMVPFCCCSFHAWLSVCGACETHSDRGASERFAAGHSDVVNHHHDDSDHHAEDGGACSGHHEDAPSPCRPDGPSDDGCKCGKHDLKMVSFQKPIVEFSTPALIATLPWVTAGNVQHPVTHYAARRFAWAEARPPTSLLRLHCALTI